MRLPRAFPLAFIALVLAAAPARGQRVTGAPDPALAGLDLAALLARGDSAWEAGREGAFPFYREVVRRDSSASSRALYRLATLRAWRNELADAVALHARYVREEPRDLEGRVALGRVQAWASRFAASIATYDAVLRDEPDYRDAALGRAQALAWAGRMRDAIAAYERWIAAHPDDREAELALARTESWAGRLDDAERRYQRLADAGDAAAEKGVARVAAWRGDLVRSERRWRALAARFPDDPEVWTGLAQVLRWTGRPALAGAALERALAAEPGYGDARAQLPWVRAELSAGLEPVVTYGNDSDDNRSTYTAVSGAFVPPWNGRVTALLSHRAAEFGATRSSSTGGRAVAWWNPLGGRLSVRGELGVARLAATVRDTTRAAKARPATAIALSAQPHRRVSVGVGLSRTPFDETAVLIANQLVTAAVDADAGVQLPGRVALAFGFGRGEVTGGSFANTRTGASASARWTARRGVQVGATARRFGYARASFGTGPADAFLSDGYFAPETYQLLEANGRWELGRDLGWNASAELGLGRQSIRPFVDAHDAGEWSSRFAQRAAASLGYRLSPGMELTLASGFANVAAPQTVSAAEYRAWSTTLRARIRL